MGSDSLDLTHIKTPEELLSFLSNLKVPTKKKETIPPCRCGLTETEFDEKGKFGCAHCYDHFGPKLEELVFPYHGGAREHVGKRPKNWSENRWMNDPVEKKKVLKLRLAKAIEVEDYERAAELKKELQQLSDSEAQSPSSTSEGQ